MVKLLASAIALLASVCVHAHNETRDIGVRHVMEEVEIHEAASDGDRSRVELLLRHDPALVSSTDEYGFTPLHGVVGEHHFDIARLLSRPCKTHELRVFKPPDGVGRLAKLRENYPR
jgi:hypothetical protein